VKRNGLMPKWRNHPSIRDSIVSRKGGKTMKRWGVVITIFYAAVVLLLIGPGFASLVFKWRTVSVFKVSYDAYHHWFPWLWAGILVGGEALLLLLAVDTSWRHAKPRQHVAVTATLASCFAAVLMVSALFAMEAGVYGDLTPPFLKVNESLFFTTVFVIWLGLWVIWGGVFYQYYRDSSNAVSEAVSWLLKGSVLELLIAVPAHIIVRHRDDCSAPLATGFGIVTGIAIMLLCFGPGVLALYKKKLDAYRSAT
jgi:hypothetical protein